MELSLKRLILIIAISTVAFSCAPKKSVLKGNHIFKYIDNQAVRDSTDNRKILDKYVSYEVKSSFKAEIVDKDSFLIIKSEENLEDFLEEQKSHEISPPVRSKIDLKGQYYTFEDDVNSFEEYQNNFWYKDLKIGLQTLTIPLKFRGKVGDGSVIPNQVETGVNIGFAPTLKINYNLFNPQKKWMGKKTNQFSLNGGILLNLGATDLKNGSSAPGITIDRKAATFTYGTFLMFGFNNFNIGYSLGWDNALGDEASKWVYQNKLWHGLVIGLDIIKP